MTSLPPIDPIALFFERQGHYLQARQLAFCRFMLDSGDQRKAAKRAGFVNPEEDGATLYSMYRDTLEAYRKEQNLDWDLAVNVYRQMAAATNKVIENEAEVVASAGTVKAKYEHVPNFSVRKPGADGLCKVFGFNAPDKLDMDVTARAELPASLQEKLDNAYKHGKSK